MKSYVFAIFLNLISVTAFAHINVHVEPSTVSTGESFRLTLTLDHTSSGGIPDLIPLQNDFYIDATEHNIATNIMNGKVFTTNQWIVLLSPKKAGTLTIPAIQVGTERSDPTQVNVREAQAPSSTSKSPTAATSVTQSSVNTAPQTVQLQTDTDNTTPYVNQQMIYTVKLLHREPLLNADYQPPQLNDALVVPLGNSQEYQTTQHGELYTVEEQRYALFPQKIGLQMLTGPSFQALTYQGGMPQRVHTMSDPIKLVVKKPPQTYTGKTWLPAKQITLKEHYNHTAEKYREGDTLIRTITLEGVAIPAELLPTFAAKPRKAFGVYPEKPSLNNTLRDQNIIGTKTFQITYLLNQVGTISLPSYTLTWFNTVTGQEEKATLPARTLHVEAKMPNTLAPSTSSPQTSSTSTLKPSSASTLMPWIISALFALAWILTFLIMRRERTISQPRARQTQPCRTKREIHKALHQACIANQPIEAQTSIITWAKHQWPQASIMHLQDVIHLVRDQALKDALTELSHVVYGTSKSMTWEGQTTWNLIRHYRHAPSIQKKKQHLPPLNP